MLEKKIRYAKLFETAKTHVQIMRFACCFEHSINLSKPKLGPDLFGITLQENALQP